MFSTNNKQFCQQFKQMFVIQVRLYKKKLMWKQYFHSILCNIFYNTKFILADLAYLIVNKHDQQFVNIKHT